MSVRELCLKNKEDKKIVGRIFIPDTGKKTYPTVIFCHGFGEHHNLWDHLANSYNEAEFACVVFDFRGGSVDSHSEGTMLEMTLMTEIDDLNTVLDAVKEMDFVDKNNIFLHGDSMGGFVSGYVSAKRKDEIKALCLWYPAFVISDDSRKRIESGKAEHFGMQLSPDFDPVAASIDIYSIIKEYTRPVLIMHGDIDGVVPLSYSQKAVETYEDAKLIVYEGADHGFNETVNVDAKKNVIEFFKKNM